MTQSDLSERPDCVVLGGGLHAKVVIDAMQLMGLKPYGVLESDRRRWGTELLTVPVLGGDELLSDIARKGVRHFTVGIGSTHDARLRRRLFEMALNAGLMPLTVRHPAAIVAPSAVLGAGVQIFAGAIVNPCTTIGDNVIINTGAIVEHDCRIGAHAHLWPGSRLAGSVIVGDEVQVSLGASVWQNLRIGNRAIVGAGAVVVNDIPEDVIVLGVPARIHRRLTA